MPIEYGDLTIIYNIEKNKPIVVDVVDTHKNFQNQWRKRRAFYKSEGCEIVTIKSEEYRAYTEPLVAPWKMVYKGKKLGSSEADCSRETNNDSDEEALLNP